MIGFIMDLNRKYDLLYSLAEKKGLSLSRILHIPSAGSISAFEGSQGHTGPGQRDKSVAYQSAKASLSYSK